MIVVAKSQKSSPCHAIKNSSPAAGKTGAKRPLSVIRRILDRAQNNGFGNPCQSCCLLHGVVLSDSALRAGHIEPLLQDNVTEALPMRQLTFSESRH